MSLQVLKLYKTLNRTIQKVFRNDPIGISAANLEIRKEFDKNRAVTSENTQKELIQYGYEVNYVLDQKVLQLQQMDDKGRYKANIRPDMEFGIDTPFLVPACTPIVVVRLAFGYVMWGLETRFPVPRAAFLVEVVPSMVKPQP